MNMIRGRCECGKVSFETETVEDKVSACHCSQCRRTSGHYWAATHTDYDKLVFTEDEGLTWYESSAWAKRGFCKYCGSSLFWRMNGKAEVGIAAGCLESPTGMAIDRHIFVADKGDYYEITDDVPQIEKY